MLTGFIQDMAFFLKMEFAEKCKNSGFKFIGPSHEIISLMGDKIQAKNLMRQLGVPVVPGYEGPVESKEQIEDEVKIGLPVIIKAAAGGGGRA